MAINEDARIMVIAGRLNFSAGLARKYICEALEVHSALCDYKQDHGRACEVSDNANRRRLEWEIQSKAPRPLALQLSSDLAVRLSILRTLRFK